MCKQVAKLQRASLRDPVKVEVSSKYQTVDKLLQYYLFIPAREKVQPFYLYNRVTTTDLLLSPPNEHSELKRLLHDQIFHHSVCRVCLYAVA